MSTGREEKIYFFKAGSEIYRTVFHWCNGIHSHTTPAIKIFLFGQHWAENFQEQSGNKTTFRIKVLENELLEQTNSE